MVFVAVHGRSSSSKNRNAVESRESPVQFMYINILLPNPARLTDSFFVEVKNKSVLIFFHLRGPIIFNFDSETKGELLISPDI